MVHKKKLTRKNKKIYRNLDCVENFFMARTESFNLLNLRWDTNLKIEEHTEFFYTAKLKGLVCDMDVSIYAANDHTCSDELPKEQQEYYKSKRGRMTKKMWHKYMRKKHDLDCSALEN